VTDSKDDFIDAEVHVSSPFGGSNTFSSENVGSFEDEVSLDRPKKSKAVQRWIAIILVAVVLVGGFFVVSKIRANSDPKRLQGKVALSAGELRDLVISKKLTVYWAGPVDGAKYTLIATSPSAAFVRYLPGGVGVSDTKTLFRAIGTYQQKDAFSITQVAGQSKGNVGFINADGNAVFYVKTRPTNVYIGIPKLNLQVEVFDPGVDQALGLALIKNQVRKIV